VESADHLSKKYSRILPHLDERQQRLYLAAEAEAMGFGGIALVAKASGVGRPTLQKGLKELSEPPLEGERVRRAGGGRKKLSDTNPALKDALKALVDPETRGDPMSPLKWVSKSTRQIADTLTKQGFRVTHTVVARMLHELGFSLQANRSNRSRVVKEFQVLARKGSAWNRSRRAYPLPRSSGPLSIRV